MQNEIDEETVDTAALGIQMTRVSLCVGLLVCIACIACIACSKSSESASAADSARVATTAPALPAAESDSASRVVRDPCPATGRWALCSLENRLRRSGFVANRVEGEAPARPGFSAKPAVYTLGRGRLEVFLYADEQAVAKDMAGIDTISVAPAGEPSSWASTPALIRSGNLAAVFMDQTPRQAERLVLAITAGAPSAR